MKPSFSIEKKLWENKVDYVIGVDEVGRGAFAGPIVAAAVVFPKVSRIFKKNTFLKDINDSKLLDPKTRTKLAKHIKKYALCYAIEEVDIYTINKFGIGYANKKVFRKVIKKIVTKIDSSNIYLLSDGYRLKYIRRFSEKNHSAIVDGDKKSITIAAASVIAKVYRDSLMANYSRKYRSYKFAVNKGYGTKSHREALYKYGLSEIHRTSFKLDKFLST